MVTPRTSPGGARRRAAPGGSRDKRPMLLRTSPNRPILVLLPRPAPPTEGSEKQRTSTAGVVAAPPATAAHVAESSCRVPGSPRQVVAAARRPRGPGARAARGPRPGGVSRRARGSSQKGSSHNCLSQNGLS
ncbi:unnamed protein product [Prorocentrum cordatum]|uniref:Uncharacterized protein n=1 Tax=Prorocentrum cordatum TaxID=2364126 RepID=A0ABN9VP13_9DINO|nr:unnamed protein product [Polarella glacialis]